MKKENINNLDDMAEYFFQIARDIGHPIKSLNIDLKDAWGKQKKEVD